MTIERAASDADIPTHLPSAVRGRIFLYLGILIVLLALGSPAGGLIDIPVSFLLKNKLHLEAHEVATFRLVAAIPLYLSFAFGFIRDSWSPFAMGDRGFMLLFGGVSALLYGLFAATSLGTTTLLLAMIALTVSFLFVSSAQNGLTAALGQQHAMTGQISALWNVFLSVPTMAALLAGGMLSDVLEHQGGDAAVRILFLVGGATMAAVALYALWRPREVFDNVSSANGAVARPLEDIRRLLRHRPIYPALLIWLLWNFAPGSTTPLQYHLQNTLHASDSQWGLWNAIFAASFIPTFIAYGFLCRRVTLKKLLWWGTVIAVPQMVPLLLIHSVTAALIAAVPIGLMGGIATGAYLDLIIRSCPRGLEGTTLMLGNSLYFAVTRFGDLLGTHLYDHFGGFNVCVLAITIVYALILPALLIVPDRLIATADDGKG
jgi:MFS family permease